MLVVGEGVDGRDARKPCEGLDIGLLEGANDHTVEHAPEDAGGVLNRFAAAKLDLAGGKKQDLAAKLADADLEAHPRPGRGFREEHPPALACQRTRPRRATGCLKLGSKIDDREDLASRHRLDGKEVLHGKLRSMAEETADAKGRGALVTAIRPIGAPSAAPETPLPR